MQTASLGGNRYFVTFIDDKSRFVAVYFMKSKDHVLQKFKEYEAMVQERRSKYFAQIMGVNTTLESLMISW